MCMTAKCTCSTTFHVGHLQKKYWTESVFGFYLKLKGRHLIGFNFWTVLLTTDHLMIFSWLNGNYLHLLLLRSTGVLPLIAALAHFYCHLKMACAINMQMIAVIFKVHIKNSKFLRVSVHPVYFFILVPRVVTHLNTCIGCFSR